MFSLKVKKVASILLLIVLASQAATTSMLLGSKTRYEVDPGIIEKYDTLLALVQNAGLPNGLTKELSASIQASESAYQHGNAKTAVNTLEALPHKIEAQTKSTPTKPTQYQALTAQSYLIPPELATELITLSTEIVEVVELAYVQLVKIGLTSSSELSISPNRAIAEIAMQYINDEMRERNSDYRFDYVQLNNFESDVEAVNNLAILRDLGINLVVGHDWSGQCDASRNYISEHNMLLFSASSTSPKLAVDDNLLRLTTNDNVQGRVLVDLYVKLGIRGVVILYRDEIYGRGLLEVIRDNCAAKGISIISEECYVDNRNLPSHINNIESALAASSLSDSEKAFQVLTYTEINEIVNIVNKGDYPTLKTITWTGCDGTARQPFSGAQLLRGVTVKLYSPQQASNYGDPRFEALKTRFETNTGTEINFYNSAMYDIFWIYAKAVNTVGSTDTTLIKNEIMSMVQNYDGVSGISSLNSDGDRIGASYDLWGFGWVDGAAGSTRLGYYDLPSDSIEMFTQNPPEVALLAPDMWSYTRYNLGDPLTSTRYNLAARVSVWDKDGPDDIATVKLVTSISEFRLTDSQWKWGFPPDDLEYFNETTYDGLPGTTFSFEARDHEGNVATLSYVYDGWVFTKFDLVLPSDGAIIPTSEGLTFNWSTSLSNVNAFVVQLSNDQGFWWLGESTSAPLTYSGPSLTPGVYHYALYARTTNRGEVVAYASFTILSTPTTDYIDIGFPSSNDQTISWDNAIATLAEEDINDYLDGIGSNHRLSIHQLNNHGSTQIAYDNTVTLNEAGIHLIVGHPWSGMCQSSLQYANTNGVLLLSQSSTSPSLAIPGDNLYRLAPSDDLQVRMLVDLYKLKGIKAVAVYYAMDVYGPGLKDRIAEYCAADGIEFLGAVGYSSSSWNPTADLTVIESLLGSTGRPNGELALEVITISTDAVTILNNVATGPYTTLKEIKWFGCDSTANSQDILNWATMQACSVNLFSPMIGPPIEDLDYQQLNERFLAQTGDTLTFYQAAAYDAFWILVKSVISANTTQTDSVKLAMQQLVNGYNGVSGPITFDINGDRTKARYDIWGYDWVDGVPTIKLFGYYDAETGTIIWFE